MVIALTLALLASATGDPCGMVPPLAAGPDATIQRDGAQRTYVMHSNGVETIALRPGFVGSVEQFGMLIPFPSPPAIRKIDDDTFAHVEAAIEPPPLQVDVQTMVFETVSMSAPMSGRGASKRSREGGLELKPDEVRVLSEEAVGMYQVAVLEAGSAKALDRWMGDNDYRYPEGMDEVVGDYVDATWCFVAVKARVTGSSGVAPRPGMRSADGSVAKGTQFDGHVQGMGFRFATDAPVVPMRLSVFNGEDPRNVVYMLTDTPVRAANLSADLVQRQVTGEQLHANLTNPLPLQLTIDGLPAQLSDVPADLAAEWEGQRDPGLYMRAARDLFAADLLAVRTGQLTLEVEEAEKELLRINESLGLRGDAVDGLLDATLTAERQVALDGALDDVKELHLTVLDGVFDGSVLAEQNIAFEPYAMPERKNVREPDPIRAGPAPVTVWRNW
jgi:hypothetical protein